VPRLFLVSFSLVIAGCGSATRMGHPDHVLQRYVEAIESNPGEAYELLSRSQRHRLSREEFQEASERYSDEVRAQARQLRLQLAEPIPVYAEVRLSSGEVVTLVLENGRWRISDGASGAVGLASPLQTVRGLRRALQRRSYQALLRVLSREARSQIEDEITRITEGLDNEEDLRIEVTGNRARVIYDGNHFLDLVREDGLWVVVDMN